MEIHMVDIISSVSTPADLETEITLSGSELAKRLRRAAPWARARLTLQLTNGGLKKFTERQAIALTGASPRLVNLCRHKPPVAAE
jgi:hypothetical protein